MVSEHTLFRITVLVSCAACWWLVGMPAAAQVLLSPEQTAEMNKVLDSASTGEALKCEIHSERPALDFQLRFTDGFSVSCPLRLFGGEKSSVNTFVRVTPKGGTPVLMGETTHLPAISPKMAAEIDPRKLNQEVEISGAFSVGEGRYRVEVLVADSRARSCRKAWTISVAARRGLEPGEGILQPGAVAPADFVPWEAGAKSGQGSLRLTVLLDAAPINPDEQKLRAVDRLLLMQFLSALLDRLPCQSVRLVAFNLDQQREIFRDERFRGGAEFNKLMNAMEALELGTVSYTILQKNQGWVQMLWKLAMREKNAMDPVDAVLIIGPATRTRMKIKHANLIRHETEGPQFFYFEYSPDPLGGIFPDSMGTLTKTLDGNSYVFHDPEDLARDIRKMLKRIPAAPEKIAPSVWPARSAPAHLNH
jgi:hypothetical protein